MRNCGFSGTLWQHRLTTDNFLEARWAETVRDFQNHDSGAPVYVGFSGGIDSTLLLKLAVQCFSARRVTALHVNHQLQSESARWQEHCQTIAYELGCELVSEAVTVEAAGRGIEAAAREARHQMFKDHTPERAIIWLGHHLDDQMETFLLRMLRGTGVQGMTGMSPIQPWQKRTLVRPFLQWTRAEVEAMAKHFQLRWIDDPSNGESDFDRNFLRHEVLARFSERWPGYQQRWNQTLEDIRALTAQQLEQQRLELSEYVSDEGQLALSALEGIPESEQFSRLHLWLQEQQLQVPSRHWLRQLLANVVNAKPDAQPQLSLGDGSVRRYRDYLYYVPELPKLAEPPLLEPNRWQQWEGVGRVRLRQATNGPRLALDIDTASWASRHATMAMQPIGRTGKRDLKRLLQEANIPPWLRERTPLLLAEGELVAVGSTLMSACHQPESSEQLGWVVDWQNDI